MQRGVRRRAPLSSETGPETRLERQEAYAAARPQCASNLIGVARLAFPEQLVEIVFKAVLPPA